MFLFSLWTRKKKQWWLYFVCVVGLQFFFITHTVGLQWKNLIEKNGGYFSWKIERKIKDMFIIWMIWMYNMLLQYLAMSFIITVCVFSVYLYRLLHMKTNYFLYCTIVHIFGSIINCEICTYSSYIFLNWSDRWLLLILYIQYILDYKRKYELLFTILYYTEQCFLKMRALLTQYYCEFYTA